MVLQIDEITRLYGIYGTALYGAEIVNHQQHAVQCAHLAEQAGSSHELVVAALLHDLGHLLAAYAERLPEGHDDGHQYAAIPFLRGLFSNAVIEPIRLHVDAKRYLCGMDSAYWARLSPASKRSLALQGGPFSASEASSFMRRPFAADAVAVRQWDDMAKDPLAEAPEWSHFIPLLKKASVQALVALA